MSNPARIVPPAREQIVSLGVDLVDVSTIRRMLARRGAALHRKALTPAERALLPTVHPDPARAFALTWAVKEAVSKALGTGLLRGFGWQDIELTPVPDRQWTATLYRGAAARAADLGITHVAVALAVSRARAVAVVVAYRVFS
jgi:holo-[acyl-carrier protein] synthase